MCAQVCFPEFTAERNSKVTRIEDFPQTTLLRYNCMFMRFLVSVQFSTLAIRKFSAFGRFGINLLSALHLTYCNISQNQRRFVYFLTQIFYWNKFKETLFFLPRMHRTGFTDTAY